jgi:hypothetical protein
MAGRISAFKWPIGATVAGLVAAQAYGGLAALGLVAALIALEATVSFDNAVVNAGVLRELGERWRRAFLTVGVIVAVFGMRVLFPIALVAAATDRSFAGVVDQAVHDGDAYARSIESAAPLIGAFGGIFLLLLALDFFMAPDRERHWLVPVERALAVAGRIPFAPVIAGGAILLATALLVSGSASVPCSCAR